MKVLIYGSLFVFVTLLSLPATADAFSRRSHHSEIASTAVTGPVTPGTTDSTGATAVPEPPVLMLMTLAFGLFAVGSAIVRFRQRS